MLSRYWFVCLNQGMLVFKCINFGASQPHRLVDDKEVKKPNKQTKQITCMKYFQHLKCVYCISSRIHHSKSVRWRILIGSWMMEKNSSAFLFQALWTSTPWFLFSTFNHFTSDFRISFFNQPLHLGDFLVWTQSSVHLLVSRSLMIPSHISVLHVEQEVAGDDTPALQSVLECDEKREALLKEEKALNAKLSSSR